MIYSHISELIGNTPLVRLSGFERAYGLQAIVAAKLEAFNPLGSAKDRIAREMLEQAIANGRFTSRHVYCGAHIRQYRRRPCVCRKKIRISGYIDHAG